MTHLNPRQLFNRVVGILTVVLAVAAGNAQAAWTWQNPLPQGNQLNDALYLDGNQGFVVGVGGLIMHTMDRGQTWSSVNSGVTANLNRIVFATADSGWIVGDAGTILWTKNGGLTWNPQVSGTTSNLYDVTFLDHSSGYAVGSNGTILRTANAGFAWAKLNSGTTATLRGLSFIDWQHGWVVGFSGTVLNTIDNGDSWTSRPGSVGSSVNLYTCWFPNMNNGWVAGDYGTVMHTRTAGATWLNDITVSPERINRLSYIPGQGKVGSCNAGVVVYCATDDSVWTASVCPLTNANFNSVNVNMMSDTGAIAWHVRFVGDKGVMINADNGSQTMTWASIAPGSRTNMYSVYFTGFTAGYAVGDSGLLFRTNDGVNWFTRTIYPGGLFRGIAFNPRNQAVGVMVGLSGLAFWTNDAGNTWTKDTSSLIKGRDLMAVAFSSNGDCYVVGGGGTVLRYSYLNSTWSALTSPTTRNLYAVYMADNLYGHVAGQGGVLYKTTDAGATWAAQNSQTTQDLNAVQVFHGESSWNGSDSIEASNGFLLGNTGVVRRTTNGGRNWLVVNMGQGSGGAFRGLRFRSMLEGVIVGPGGAIYKTTNGGTSWTQQSSPTKSNLNAVWVVDQATGWAVGENGTILYNGDVALPVEVASFAGWQEGSGAKLAWTTASEQGNARFEIERSTFGSSWVTVGSVAGNGTTSDRHTYTFADAKLAPNTYTYRLKQIDNSGASHYVATEVEVTVAAPSTLALYQNYPNPFNPTTNISYDLQTSSNVSLDVYTMAGNHVATLKSAVEDAGHHVVTFDASSLSSGTYEYRLTVNGNVMNRQMNLVK